MNAITELRVLGQPGTGRNPESILIDLHSVGITLWGRELPFCIVVQLCVELTIRLQMEFSFGFDLLDGDSPV